MMLAYCFASGHIGFGDALPEGALPIARGEPGVLEDFIRGVALCACNRTLIVPGLSEASDEIATFEVLQAFLKTISEKLPEGVSTPMIRPRGVKVETATVG
jgi:hypothetical protein